MCYRSKCTDFDTKYAQNSLLSPKFRILYQSKSLYHWNATFCKPTDYSAACEQACHHKRLGGGNVIFDGPVESFDVNDAVRLTSGMPEYII